MGTSGRGWDPATAVYFLVQHLAGATWYLVHLRECLHCIRGKRAREQPRVNRCAGTPLWLSSVRPKHVARHGLSLSASQSLGRRLLWGHFESSSWPRSRRRRRRQLGAAPRILISTPKPRLVAWSLFPAFGCVVTSYFAGDVAGCTLCLPGVYLSLSFQPPLVCPPSPRRLLLRITDCCCKDAVPSVRRSLT